MVKQWKYETSFEEIIEWSNSGNKNILLKNPLNGQTVEIKVFF